MDIYALLESMLRFVLLFFAVSSWRRSSGEVRSYYDFLLIVVLGMELMWALGTINWGTATRHHVPGHSVIVLLGVPWLDSIYAEITL
jgi:predicted RND superfamily exporter protein